MSTSYQKSVLVYFEQKRNQHTLSKNLLKPTPAGLREECLHVYAEKRKIENEPVLRRFFGPSDSGNNYTQKIRKCATDKFKPLANFLKGETSNPQDKHIELLAWLIDFQTASEQTVAPQQNVEQESLLIFDKRSSSEQQNNQRFLSQSINQSASGEANTSTHLFKVGRFMVPLKFSWTIAAFMAVVMTLFGSYIFFERSNQCMYWTGIEYESIACNEKMGDAPIIALDTFKLAHLKKITRNDTITRNALGHVWYVKVKTDSAEFYTAAGNYPINNRKRLMPLTEYMLKKYILKPLK